MTVGREGVLDRGPLAGDFAGDDFVAEGSRVDSIKGNEFNFFGVESGGDVDERHPVLLRPEGQAILARSANGPLALA